MKRERFENVTDHFFETVLQSRGFAIETVEFGGKMYLKKIANRKYLICIWYEPGESYSCVTVSTALQPSLRQLDDPSTTLSTSQMRQAIESQEDSRQLFKLVNTLASDAHPQDTEEQLLSRDIATACVATSIMK